MKKTKGIIIAVSVCLAIAVALSSIIFFAVKTSVKDSDIVASVNGYEICAEEMKLQMQEQRGYVIDELGEGKTIDDKFWKTEINGITPLEELKQRALDYLVRYKVEQQIAVETGVIKKEDASFENSMNAMKTENASREQKVNNGEIIYGVKEYTYSSYHTYTYSNMQIDTREVLGKKGNALYADDKELKTWYESVKQERYPKFDTMKFDYYKINWTDDITTDKASSLMQKARKEFIEQGSYNVGNVQYIHLTIDDDNASDLQKTSPIFFETIQKMKVGDVTEVISENASSFFAVLKSTKKAGYKDFEEHKSAIYTEYIDEKYEGFVDNRVKSAKVEKTDKLKYLKMD